ncbi:MAG: hypothetical protein KJ831_03540, partial [Candidatus Eisenbacteria bacterium]|nr:hypothetical protein [Candidatus Eisenbacteria bacterium]
MLLKFAPRYTPAEQEFYGFIDGLESDKSLIGSNPLMLLYSDNKIYFMAGWDLADKVFEGRKAES